MKVDSKKNGGIEVSQIEENISLLYRYKNYYRLFCITDAPLSQIKLEIAHFAFFQCFEDIIISEEVGLNKDDPEIYRYICGRHKLLPEKTLFIDDRIKNITAALKVGMGVVHYDCRDLADKICNRQS